MINMPFTHTLKLFAVWFKVLQKCYRQCNSHQQVYIKVYFIQIITHLPLLNKVHVPVMKKGIAKQRFNNLRNTVNGLTGLYSLNATCINKFLFEYLSIQADILWDQINTL